MLTGRKVEGALKKLFWALLGPDISPGIENRHTWWGQQRSLNAREPARDMETSYHNFLWIGESAAYGYAAAGSQACVRTPQEAAGGDNHMCYFCVVFLFKPVTNQNNALLKKAFLAAQDSFLECGSDDGPSSASAAMSGVPQPPDADENGAQAIQGNDDIRGAACHRPSELRVRPASRKYLPDL